MTHRCVSIFIYFYFPQFGIFDIPDINLDGGDDEDTDSDMEAELAAITAGSGQPRRRAKPKAQPNVDLDRMVAESLRDVDLDGDDDDIDENDPDLLNELSEIVEPEEMEQEMAPAPVPKPQSSVILPTTNSMPDLLKSRVEMYKLAEANAKAANDSSKARRIGRGLKTLETMLKQALAGKTINPDEIPPEVATGGAKPATPPSNENDETPASTPVRAAPAIPTAPATPVSPPEPMTFKPTTEELPKPDNSDKIELLLARQREYKAAALSAKKSGDMEKALGFVKISKMFDAVIKAAQDGQPVDLSDMPPSPSEMEAQMEKLTPAQPQPRREESQTQNTTEDVPPGSTFLPPSLISGHNF